MQITERNLKVLDCLTPPTSLTIPKTAKILGISRIRVYQHIDILRKAGMIKGTSFKGFTKTEKPMAIGSTSLYKPLIRLHNIQWRCEIKNRLRTHNKKKLDGVTITFHGNVILFHQRNEQSFIGKTTEECLAKSNQFWGIFFQHFEDKYNTTILLREKTHKGEFEEVSSEFAINAKKKGDKIYIRDKEGKAWLVTDKSLNTTNTEAKHAQTSPKDSEMVFDRVFNSYRERTALEPLEVTRAIDTLRGIQEDIINRQHKDFYEKVVTPFQAEMKTHLGLLRQEIITINKSKKERKFRQEGLGKWL